MLSSVKASKWRSQALRLLARSPQLRRRRQLLSSFAACISRDTHPLSTIDYAHTFAHPNRHFLQFLQLAKRLAAHHAQQNQPFSAHLKSESEPNQQSKSPKEQSQHSKSDASSKHSTAQQAKKNASSSGKESKQSSDDDQNNSWMGQAALALFVMLGLSLLGSRDQGREISFQAFVWDLLEPGLVDRIEVVNRNVARVYLKTSATVRSQDVGLEAKGVGAKDKSLSDERTSPDPWDTRSFDRDGTRRTNSTRITPTANTINSTESPFYFTIGSIDTFEKKLEAVQEDLGLEPDDFVPVVYTKESSITTELLRQAPSILLLAVGIMVLRNALSQFGGMGGGRSGIFQVGKANPTVIKGSESSSKAITFAQVAGLDEAKIEVMEFVDFLKNPSRYERLGARIPRGALLVGPPGTGKTLLAKATAGEASVPFFSMSGSDFIEMFVGVGPSRIRDLFSQARASAPCIIFIDEIDAIGKARGRGGLAGGNDERENTLNALLVEMDGFSSTSGVVVLAGTNRADVLDKALLRPGRFDRQISIDKPDMRGRYQIFMVHLQPLKLKDEPSTIAKKFAALTPGFAGADIANICNEAALIAARGDKDFVEMSDFESATDRVIGGLEKKNKVISRKEREIVAHHEAGHAVAGWFLKHADPLIKVSIIPRGSAALGFAQYLPTDKFLQSTEQLKDFMIVALGGRVAEHLCFGSITTGAQDDLKRITRAAYAQITNFGMSEKVGKVYFPKAGESGNQFYKPYSESTAELIDAEAIRMVDEAYRECEELLSGKLDLVKGLAARLLEKEVIAEDDLVDVLGDRPYAKPATYDEIIGRYEKDRRERTGSSGGDDDGAARGGATTPPIPVEGAEEQAKEGSYKRPGRVGPTEEVIPELA